MPPLTIENAGALVEGGGASALSKETDVKKEQAGVAAEVQFTVVRAFYYKGEVLEVGKTYPLPRVFAIEMQHANKGKIKVEEPAAAAPSAPAKSPESSVKKEESKHVR